jgi:hypothetical protein
MTLEHSSPAGDKGNVHWQVKGSRPIGLRADSPHRVKGETPCPNDMLLATCCIGVLSVLLCAERIGFPEKNLKILQEFGFG